MKQHHYLLPTSAQKEVEDQIPWPVIERICHHLIRSQSKNPSRGVTEKQIERMRIPLVVHSESLLSLIMELRSFYSHCSHINTGMVTRIKFHFFKALIKHSFYLIFLSFILNPLVTKNCIFLIFEELLSQ